MRRLLTCALATLTALALTAGPASATTCPLLSDPVGDGVWSVSAGLVRSDGLDIVSGDVATGATTVVAVLRLRDLATADPVNKLGVSWRFGWNMDGVPVEAQVRLGIQGTTTASYTVGGVPVPLTYSVDYYADTVTWTVQRSDVPGLVAGATFDLFRANSNVLSSTADNALDATTSYVDGDPACIPAA